MPFNLIMPRKVFAKVQCLCDEYEETYQEKIATARLVNVLLCEALIERELIPKTFIKEKYGSNNPIEEGFTKKARELSTGITREEKFQKDAEISKITKTFSEVIKQWSLQRSNPRKWREGWVKKAEKWKDIVPNAKLVLGLANGETVPPHVLEQEGSP